MKRLRPLRAISIAPVLAAFCNAPANAGSIGYQIDEISVGGAASSFSGEIVTDGTLGVLTVDNILSWYIYGHIGLSSAAVSGPPHSIEIVGTGLTATDNELFFDFGATGSYAKFSYTAIVFCFNAGTEACPGEPSGFFMSNSFSSATVAKDGLFVLSDTTFSPAGVPGPIVGAGIPGLLAVAGFISWRRSRRPTKSSTSPSLTGTTKARQRYAIHEDTLRPLWRPGLCKRQGDFAR
jgi:hypothetical protein